MAHLQFPSCEISTSFECYENPNGELVVPTNFIIESPSGTKYQILKKLGSGQFGHVYHAVDVTDPSNNSPQSVAIKITKSQYRYRQQAQSEIQMLQKIMDSTTPEEQCCISRLFDWFNYNDHICIVMELLSLNLYSVLEWRKFHGLQLPLIQSVARNLLTILSALKRCEIIHCDIKPENVVLADGFSTNVKLIDYGSSIFTSHTNRFYIQSRYYRAPEVILELNYSHPIDMWSYGCLLFELFTGIPLFPGQDEYQMLVFFIQFRGAFPDEMMRATNRRDEFFLQDGTLKCPEQYYAEKGINPNPIPKIFQLDNITEIVLNYESGIGDTAEERKIERDRRIMFIDFIEKLLALDPRERMETDAAANHPFITTDFS
ncbi:CMGC family protein kinase [Histomonas meleagridis]|uniref:CMGC family protein kinase n=1 Tax=Histomonas meleagridis TaxID=135588 RepID=UPI00355A8407|nr:CMGC family protein kinase [Histomonas meleagridis]KAH0804482.1 CMGC family protein kinase [Histomonas meleagridis]